MSAIVQNKSDLRLEALNENDVKTFLEKWQQLNKEEYAIFFYKSLFELYPDTKKMFVKFSFVANDELGTNKCAMNQGKALWASIDKLHKEISQGDVKSANETIKWVAEVHFKIKTFKPESFEYTMEPFCLTVEQYLGKEYVNSFRNVLRVILDSCVMKCRELK